MAALFQRLKLKDKPFITHDPATEEDINSLRDKILKIDSSLDKGETTTLKSIEKVCFHELLEGSLF